MMKRDEAIAQLAIAETDIKRVVQRYDDVRRDLTAALRDERDRDTGSYSWTKIFVEIGKLLERSDRQELVQQNRKLQDDVFGLSEQLRKLSHD